MNDLYYRMHHILAGAWRRRYVIVTPVLVLPILGVLVSMVTPKKFTAHTSMLIQETAKMNPFLEDLAVSSMLKERMAALQTLLHSRHILGAVADERGLLDANSSAERRDEVIAELSSALKVDMAGKDLIRIDFAANSADGMKEMLETVSKHFVEQLLAPERSSMKDSAYFLAKHLKLRREDLDKGESELANFKDEHAAELPELHASNITRLSQLRQRLAEREAELAGAQKSLGGLNRQLSRTNPVVGRIEEQIVTTRGELALLKARYTNGHSGVRGALRTLRRLEEERQRVLATGERPLDPDKLWDIASTAQIGNDDSAQPLLVAQLENVLLARSKHDGLQEETTRLRSLIEELATKTAGFGNHERELLRIQRDLKVKRALYEDLLNRYEMARVTGSLGNFEQSKRIKIIDRPFTPTAPSNLPMLLFALGGLLGGIFLGSGLALVAELTDNTIRRRDQLQLLTGLPVLSRLANVDPVTGEWI